MTKIGQVKEYDNWNGIISSGGREYKFRLDDVREGKVKVGDEVEFVPECFTLKDQKQSIILTARFVKKKELSNR